MSRVATTDNPHAEAARPSPRPLALDISVAVATMDRPAGLSRFLGALLTGVTLPAEVIVVDQGQGEAARRVVEQCQRGSPVPISYSPQARRGLSASRNAALEQAARPILAVTDDDCVPDAGWISALDRAFALPSAPDVVTGRVLPLGPPGPHLHAVSSRRGTEVAEFRGKALPWLVGTGGNSAFRRTWLARVGGYDERLGAGSRGQSAEDLDLFYRLLRAGARIRYEPNALVYHERQSTERRLASRESYGHGMGALCGIWLRRRDPYAARILARCCLDRGRALAGAARRRRWLQAYGQALYMRGLVLGLAYGLRVPEMGGAWHRRVW